MKKSHIAPEVKAQIINRIKNDGVSVTQATQDHGVSTASIYTWLGKKVEGGPSPVRPFAGMLSMVSALWRNWHPEKSNSFALAKLEACLTGVYFSERPVIHSWWSSRRDLQWEYQHLEVLALEVFIEKRPRAKTILIKLFLDGVLIVLGMVPSSKVLLF